MTGILFLCVGNSSRSQMAEGLARQIFGHAVQILSAGSQPSRVNPLAVAAMADIGIDISLQISKSVESIDLAEIDQVVTLCADEVCPVLPGSITRLHWPITDPDAVSSGLSDEEAHTQFSAIRDQLKARIEILAALLDIPPAPRADEFHGSIRVTSMPGSARFYAWLLNIQPKEWTHRYVTFIHPGLKLNFVLLVSDGKALNHDTLYHLGIGVANREAVIDAYHRAVAFGAHVEKPPRTTWKGTPLHELWLKDPDGTLIEIYARLTDVELAQMPEDQMPTYLVPGTQNHGT